jgi:PIN domain nuclease of toxin-antitoxin system
VRLLLDTHVLIWWDAGEELSTDAREAIGAATDVYVSAASAWEVSIKRTLGKLSGSRTVSEAATASGFAELPILMRHAEAVERLPSLHRDPFDRLLVAQAQVERLVIVTRDPEIVQYDVDVVLA